MQRARVPVWEQYYLNQENSLFMVDTSQTDARKGPHNRPSPVPTMYDTPETVSYIVGTGAVWRGVGSLVGVRPLDVNGIAHQYSDLTSTICMTVHWRLLC